MKYFCIVTFVACMACVFIACGSNDTREAETRVDAVAEKKSEPAVIAADQSANDAEAEVDTGNSKGDDSEAAPTFEATLLKIAGEYQTTYTQTDGLWWAPTMCMSPPQPTYMPSRATEGEHSDKVFFAWVKEPLSYGRELYSYSETTGIKDVAEVQPTGQVVVKEAFKPNRVTKAEGEKWQKEQEKVKARGWYEQLKADEEGMVTIPGDPAALFIMTKLDPKTPGTDQGWVYGTVTPDGKTITSVGRVKNCMGCHIKANHDRLFGLADAKRVTKPLGSKD